MRPKRKKTASEELGLSRGKSAPDDAEKKEMPEIRTWINEIEASKKREKDFRKKGTEIESLYAGDKAEKTPFNVLFSNTETLLPALYSAVPRPVVQRRFKDDDPLGKAAAQAGQRVLEFLLDTNVDGYETYDEGMRMAVLDGLLPGRGVTCIKYDAEIGQNPTGSIDDEVPDSAEDAAEDATENEDEGAESSEYKKSELVCVDTRSWDRVYFGYAKKWSKMPWVAFEEYIDKEEATRLFGDGIAKTLIYTTNESSEEKKDGETPKEGNSEDRNQGERKTALIYQIWDKDGGRKIRYVSSQHMHDYLKVVDDPLELTGFYNFPKPLTFVEKSNDMMPTAMYCLYERQAEELNEITRRIRRIVQAIKARGIYDSGLGGDIQNLMEADDNALVPSDNSASLAAEKGLQNAIWFMPIEQLVAVLMQLFQAREQCKRVIYEITGISDIIRGSTVASETATAQNLKSQWGTLRLKRLQKEVQRYARDILRMMLEVAATKFSEETWAKMTGLPFLLESKFNELTSIAQALQQVVMQQQQQQAAMMQAQPPQPGQPPQQQPPSKEMQELQQISAELQKPKWSDVLAMLRDDMQRAYRIDIETNSTVEPEAAEDQKNITEMMNALGQYLNGVGPLVAKGVMPLGAAQSMLLAISRRFRFGSEIEDEIKQMKAPPPEGAEDAAAKQAEMQQKQKEGELRLQEAQLKLQGEQRRDAAEAQRQQMEAARMEREHQLAMEELDRKAAADREKHDMEMEALRSKHRVGMELGAMKIAQAQQSAKQSAKKPAAGVN